MQKMFHEADLLVLEDRSNSRVRSFKIFEDKQVFPEIYEKDEFQPLDKEEKHDVSPQTGIVALRKKCGRPAINLINN